MRIFQTFRTTKTDSAEAQRPVEPAPQRLLVEAAGRVSVLSVISYNLDKIMQVNGLLTKLGKFTRSGSISRPGSGS